MAWLWARVGWLIYWVGGLVLLPLFINGSKRTRVVLYDPETKKIALVKSWISAQQWDVPGGGIGKNESAIEGAIREIREEVGIELKKAQCKSLGTIRIQEHIASYSVEVFLVEISETKLNLQRPEILGAGWFNIEKLPKNTRLNSIELALRVI